MPCAAAVPVPAPADVCLWILLHTDDDNTVVVCPGTHQGWG